MKVNLLALKDIILFPLVLSAMFSFSSSAQSHGATFTSSQTNCSPVLGRCTVTKVTMTYDASNGTWSVTSVTEYSIPYEVEQPPLSE